MIFMVWWESIVEQTQEIVLSIYQKIGWSKMKKKELLDRIVSIEERCESLENENKMLQDELFRIYNMLGHKQSSNEN